MLVGQLKPAGLKGLERYYSTHTKAQPRNYLNLAYQYGLTVTRGLTVLGGSLIMKHIAVTQRVEVIEHIGERRDALSQEWTRLAQACGFLPVILPNHLPTVQRMLEVQQIDGILLSGGNDLAAYGGDTPERDEVERYLIGRAIHHRLPLLGVCRGMQMLCHYFGTALKSVEGHVRTQHRLDNGDCVNSFHNWGATDCCPPLIAQAVCQDGVIEEIKHSQYPDIHGIMWHPERYDPFREVDLTLIRSVFQL